MKYTTDILSEIQTWCHYADTVEEITYGALYNWYAVDDAREITADGWHIPTDDEVIILSTYLDPATDPLIRGPVSLIAGEYLKEIGTVYWSAPNAYSSNTVKFNARGSGGRNQDGTFSFLKSYFFAWCSTLYSGYPDRFDLFYSQAFLIRSSDYHKKGKALRPIKDSTTLTHGQTGTYTDPSGYVYRTICIGTQEWVADNIKTEHYSNGDAIPVVTDNATWAALVTGAMCYYDNDSSNA